MKVTIEPLELHWLDQLIPFCDQQIGPGYYTKKNFPQYFEHSKTVSFIAIDENQKIVGLRLSFVPGQWHLKFPKGLSPNLWNIEGKSIGYFKSLFLHEDYRGKNLGQKLSQLSIDSMKIAGAKAIICHSWKESPQNSSYRYLSKMGFKNVAEHPFFWADIDYLCSGCQIKPCRCTATEMILYF